MADELEQRIDELFGLPPDRFTTERDALVKQLRAAGDRSAADRVKELRKPVVAAWALNQLARRDPRGVAELVRLGTRLRDAHRRAVSGGDVETLRQATEERRTLVGRLARVAAEILEETGTGAGPHEDQITSTLDAAAVDEEAGDLVRSGRLVKPLRPPASFGEGGLRVLEGGRRSTSAADATGARERDRTEEARGLERELRAAESAARRSADAVERARRRYDELDRRRADARDTLRDAEAGHRGVELERRRLAARLEKLKPPR